MLSPLSVRPDRQGRGIGTRLVRHLLAIAAHRPEPAIFVEGPPGYYARFGFEMAGAVGIRRPSLRIPESAFQIKRLPAHEPALSGALVYPEPFWAFDCVGLRDLHRPVPSRCAATAQRSATPPRSGNCG